MNIFSQKEKPKTDSAVFRVITGTQLIFGLGQIKGNPFAFRHGADHEDDKRQGLDQNERVLLLPINDIHDAEGVGQYDNRYQ